MLRIQAVVVTCPRREKSTGSAPKGKISDGNLKAATPGESKSVVSLVFDFSPQSAWCSCSSGAFNNYLVDETDFMDKFRSINKLVSTLSEHKPSEVFNSGSFRHCHSLGAEKSSKVAEILVSKLGVSEQLVLGETLMQAGLDKGVRIVGTLTGSLFRVYLMDYNHSVYPDEKKNRVNKRNRRFCPVNGEIVKG